MSDPVSTRPGAIDRLQLGTLVLDLGEGELRDADGHLAGLRRQALQVLLTLGRRAGQVVSKDDLMRAVWPDVIVGEGSLTQAIADVRRALGDSEHRRVRNVARRGYLLLADPAHAMAEAPALSIAVMPLAIEGDIKTNEWLADALHGDLVTEMARLYGVVVIARDTTATYKGRPVDPRQVARDLCVRHLVLGSMRLEGERIRLNLALVDGESGVQSWAESFVVERARLPQALAELAGQIVRALQPQLVRSEVARHATLSALAISADDLAMQAAAKWFRGVHAENLVEALKLLERAVALDSDSVRGWGGLTFMNLHGVLNDWLPDRAAALRRIDEATAHLERLESEGHYLYQARVIQSFVRRDWAAMIRIDTSWIAFAAHPGAFASRGLALLLTGEFNLAVEDLQQALRLSPRDPLRADWQYRLAAAHFFAEHYELAHEWAQTAADSHPGLPWPPIHAAALQRLGQSTAARRIWSKHLDRHPAFGPEQIARRLPAGGSAAFDAGLERLLSALRSVGMR